MDNMYGFLALSAGLMFIFFLIGIVLYVLKALGLYKLAVAKNIENPWLAWLPFGDLYILGKIIGNLRIGTYDIPKIELVLPIASVIVAVLSNVPVIGSLLNIAFLILLFFALYKLYSIYKPQNAVIWIVLSIFMFLIPIFIFIIRDEKPVNV